MLVGLFKETDCSPSHGCDEVRVRMLVSMFWWPANSLMVFSATLGSPVGHGLRVGRRG
jgi:hypothetical protein